MTRFLLEINVLIALIDPAHVQHDRAHTWFAPAGQKAWATCPLTENGVMRIVGHPATQIRQVLPQWCLICWRHSGSCPVMPFWPETLGMRRHQLIRISENIRMGCAIFRAYLRRENNNIARALARYNGSTGKRTYSDKVIAQWTRWNGADDLGRTGTSQPEVKLVVR